MSTFDLEAPSEELWRLIVGSFVVAARIHGNLGSSFDRAKILQD